MLQSLMVKSAEHFDPTNIAGRKANTGFFSRLFSAKAKSKVTTFGVDTESDDEENKNFELHYYM